MFIEFILKNWKLIVSIGLIVVIVGLGGYIKLLHANISTLKAEKKEMQTALDVSQESIKGLRASINEQNEAVDKLKTDAELRERSHSAALAAARASTVTATRRAADLMAAMAPQNLSKCDAANQLINSEISRAK